MKNSFWIIASVMASVVFLASSSGRNDRRAGASGALEPSCASCHGGGSTDGGVTVSGLPAEYEAGVKYNITLQVDDANAVRAGLQVVVNDGTSGDMIGSFTAGSGTRVVAGGSGIGRLTQSGPRNFSSGSVSWDFCWTAPTTGSLDNVIFNWSVVAANGNGSTSGDAVYTGNSGAIALPVELVEFTAVQSGSKVDLVWSTASEINADYFAIERRDNNADFVEIGRVSANGNTSELSSYDFTDDDIQGLSSALYRLRQVDLDGKIEYSDVVQLDLLRTIKDVDIWPNPYNRSSDLRIDIANNNVDELMIFNVQGQLIYQQRISQSASQSLSIPLHQYVDENGMYVVRLLQDAHTAHSSPILVMD